MQGAKFGEKDPEHVMSNAENVDERFAKSLSKSEPAVRNKCNCDAKNNSSLEPISKARYSNAFKTICDVKVHPDDAHKAFKGSRYSFRIVGEGKPKVISLMSKKQKQKMGPCELKVYKAHEQIHVKNASANCAAFKKCINSKSSYFFNTVSWNDYADCSNRNDGGLDPDCVKDEKAAYTESTAVAAKLSTDPACAAEKAILDQAVIQHGGYATIPPNCR